MRAAGNNLVSVLLTCVIALATLGSAAQDVEYPQVLPGYAIELPRDEGSHPQFRTEWWYLTGWLEDEAGRSLGFQVTFFRHRPGGNEDNPSRFAAKQLLFAHASFSDPANGKLLRAEKIARAGFGLAEARAGALDVHIDDWSLRRMPNEPRLTTAISADEFELELEFEVTQPALLHGRDGYSQKTPVAAAASYYYSLPQLRASGHIAVRGKTYRVTGSAWLDHEWFGDFLDETTQGWDWIGLNLDDRSVVMASRIRDARDEKYWAFATVRDAQGATRMFAPQEVDWEPGRRWRSPRTGREYPVEWRVRIGERTLRVRPLFDDQENDARGSTGTIYWEGAVRVFDAEERQIGKGYLELTGYGERIRF